MCYLAKAKAIAKTQTQLQCQLQANCCELPKTATGSDWHKVAAATW